MWASSGKCYVCAKATPAKKAFPTSCEHVVLCGACRRSVLLMVAGRAVAAVRAGDPNGGQLPRPSMAELVETLRAEAARSLFVCPFEPCTAVFSSELQAEACKLLYHSDLMYFPGARLAMKCGACYADLTPGRRPADSDWITEWGWDTAFCRPCSENMAPGVVLRFVDLMSHSLLGSEDTPVIRPHSLLFHGADSETPVLAQSLPASYVALLMERMEALLAARQAVARASGSSIETSKHCPRCGCPCQKQDSYRKHERRLGLPWGSDECNHISCPGCALLLCYVCMQERCDGACPATTSASRWCPIRAAGWPRSRVPGT